MKLKNLIKSYGFWTALAGALVVLVDAIGKMFNFEIEDELINDIVLAVAGVLVVFGIISVPKEMYEIKNEKSETEKEEDEKTDKKGDLQ